MGLEMIHDSVRRQHNDARINGVSPKPADASTQMPAPTPAASSMRRTLPDICFEIRNKIDAFLCEETDDDVLRKVQNQVRVSIDVIGEALRRYG
jgi:FAD synthetase